MNKSIDKNLNRSSLNKTQSSTHNNIINKTKLPEEDLNLVAVMNTLIRNHEDYITSNNWNQIKNDRQNAIDSVISGNLTKELAFLACYKIYKRLLEKQQIISTFSLDNLVKDYIVQKNGRLNCKKLYFEGNQRDIKEKLFTEVKKEKLKIPEIYEITNILKVGLTREEVLSLCLDINTQRLSQDDDEFERHDENNDLHNNNDNDEIGKHVLVNDFIEYINNIGPFVYDKHGKIENTLKKSQIRKDSFINQLKVQHFNFEFSTMDYNQYMKNYKKILNECILQIFGDIYSMFPNDPRKEKYMLEYNYIKKNLKDIDTYIDQMRMTNANLANNKDSAELFKYYSDSIKNQFITTKKVFKEFK